MARLGDLERAVMEVLWADQPGTGRTGREVLTALAGRRLAYTTVMTVLDRLAGKAMVLRQRDGQVWRYRPAAPREAYIAQLMLEALDLAPPEPGGENGDRDAALVRFASSVTDEEAALLRAALSAQASRRTTEPEG